MTGPAAQMRQRWAVSAWRWAPATGDALNVFDSENAENVSPGRRVGTRSLALGHFGIDVVGAGFFALIPATVERLDVSLSMVGVLIALFSITSLGSQPVLGAVADRRGHAATAAIAVVIGSFLLATTAVMPSIVALLGVVIVGGLGSGAFHAAGAALAGTSNTNSPERSVAIFAAASTVGLGVGPIVAISLLRWWGGWSMLALALPASLAGALIWTRSDRADLGRVERVGRLPLNRLVRDRTIVVATLVALTTTVIVATIPIWISAQPDRSSHDPSIGIALGAFSLASAAGGVAGSALTTHMAPGRLLQRALIGAGLASAAIFLTTPATALFYVALVLAGLLTGPTLPILLVAAQEMFPEQRAAASGTVVGLSNGVGGAAFLAIAVLLDVVGFRAAAILGLATLLPAAAIVGTIPVLAARTTDRRKESTALVVACGCVVPCPTPVGALA